MNCLNKKWRREFYHIKMNPELSLASAERTHSVTVDVTGSRDVTPAERL